MSSFMSICLCIASDMKNFNKRYYNIKTLIYGIIILKAAKVAKKTVKLPKRGLMMKYSNN